MAPGLLASTALASSPSDTPVLRLFREWDGVQADMVVRPDEHMDALCDTSSSLERRIVSEPLAGPLDLAAKVVASSCYGEFPVSPEAIRRASICWA